MPEPPAHLAAAPEPHDVNEVREADLDALLPLVRAYCDFYATSPSEEALRELSLALIAAPQLEGFQLIARDARARAIGFASVFWSWDTTEGARIGIMNDLYVAPAARGSGITERLIEGCRARCSSRGAVRLEWMTAPENGRARSLYERVGGVLEPWLIYTLPARHG